MPTITSISFNVKFDLTGAPTIVLTDATTYPVGAIGIYTITQPDGYVRTGNFTTPDVTSSGGTFSSSLRLSSTGGVQCGTYNIKYEIKTTDLVVTTFTRNFYFSYDAVDLILKENFDVFTPNLSYADTTVYQVAGYNDTSPTRSWVAISTPTGTLTSTGSSLSLAFGGQYYDAIYTITLSSTLTYQHQTYSWLSILETVSKTVTAEACTPEPILDLIPLLETLRQQSIQCNGDFPKFEKAQALYSHLTDMLKALLIGGVTQDGIYDVYEDLWAVLHNDQVIECIHTNLPISSYDISTYNSSVNIYNSNGVLTGNRTITGNGYSLTYADNKNEGTIFSITNNVAGTLSRAGFLATSVNGSMFIGKVSSAYASSTASIDINDAIITNSVNGDISIYNSVGTGRIKFTSNAANTPQMVLSENGRVLIGSLTDSALAKLQVTGAIQQSSVVSSLLKTNSNGVIVSAVSGTDYVVPSSLSGYVLATRTLTINGTAYDLSSDRSWTISSGTVTSVGLSMPSAFTVTNSPVTSSGTLTVVGAGTTSQYIRGDGTLATFPTLTGYVPYTGATANVNLGVYNLTNTGSVTTNSLTNTTTFINEQTSGVYNYAAGTTAINASATYIAFVRSATQRFSLVYASGNLTYTMPSSTGTIALTTDIVNQSITLSGDISGTGTTAITTAIGTNKVTNAMLAQIATGTFHGRVTAATGNVETLTGTQATTLLDVFSSTLKGLAPASGGGTTNFLRADGTWAAPATGGTGTVTSVAALTLGTTGTDLSSSVANGTTTPVITLNVPTASATNRGALSSTDWSTFNGKESVLTFSSPLSRATNTISIPAATTSINGYLTSTDWTTFNGKQAGSTNLTSLAGLTYVSASFVKMTASGTFSLDTATYLTANQTITLSGDVSGSGTTAITTAIGTNKVTNAMLAQIATASFHGRLTAGTGNVETLTGTQATTLLDVFSSTLKGLAPASGGGTTNFLRADGTWAAPATGGTGTVTSVAMTVPTGLSIGGTPITTSGTLALTFTAGYAIPTTASQTNWDTAYTNRITSLTTTTSSGAATLSANILNIPNYTLAGLGGQPLNTNLTSLSTLSWASGSPLIKMTAAGTFSLDTNIYLTANQTINLTGAVTGSGNTTISTTLSNSVVGIANLSATGTASASTYLRGDNTWASVPSTGYTVTSQNTTYSVTATSGTLIVKCDTTTAGFTVTLPTAVSNGATIVIKKTVAVNTLTIATTSSQTIDGGTTALLKVNGSSITLISDNANWQIV